MADVRAFIGIRPKENMVKSIASLPYDVYSSNEARKIVEENPNSFLKIDRAETQLSLEIDLYSNEVYQKAAETLIEMLRSGKLVKDENKCYYVYELTMEGRTQTGLVGCTSIDDYMNGIIMRHENTRKDKEQDRIKHVDICNAHTGPIFMIYQGNSIINNVIKKAKREKSLYDFISADKVQHCVWMINGKEDIEEIEKGFEMVKKIYIADGHHRAAAAVSVGNQRRKTNDSYAGGEEFNYFLSVLFPSEQVEILGYNRVVEDLNGNSVEDFLYKIGTIFEVKKFQEHAYIPEEKGCIGMYLDKKWYKLKIINRRNTEHPVDRLDVAYLQDTVLSVLLDIRDPQVDHRISFIGGIKGIEVIEKKVNKSKLGVAFTMYPTSVEELLAVADANSLMPPKSTWFEPKLMSGLFIHQF